MENFDDEFNDNFEDFNNDLDPVEKAKLQEIYEAEIENAMREAFQFIEEMGEDNWIKSNKVPITTSRKLTIVENMINWFADPIREEYEKAAKMKRILDKIKK